MSFTVYHQQTAPFQPKHGDVWTMDDGVWCVARVVTTMCNVAHKCGCTPLPVTKVEWDEKSQEEINAYINGLLSP